MALLRTSPLSKTSHKHTPFPPSPPIRHFHTIQQKLLLVQIQQQGLSQKGFLVFECPFSLIGTMLAPINSTRGALGQKSINIFSPADATRLHLSCLLLVSLTGNSRNCYQGHKGTNVWLPFQKVYFSKALSYNFWLYCTTSGGKNAALKSIKNEGSH